VTKPHALRLYEETLLLALRNDKGTVAGGVMYEQAAGGAILAELILEHRVSPVTEGRSTYAVVADRTPLGDPILDECLKKIEAASRRKKLASWVGTFAGLKGLKHRVAAGLREKGVLREEEGRVLLLFTRRLYPELDPAYEKAVVERLSEAIFNTGSVVDARTTVLAALAHHSGLLKANLDRRRLKEHRQRLEAVIKGDAVGKATKQAIDAVHAAVMVAVIVPAIVAN
jgi:golgi phosphoprotein 3